LWWLIPYIHLMKEGNYLLSSPPLFDNKRERVRQLVTTYQSNGWDLIIIITHPSSRHLLRPLYLLWSMVLASTSVTKKVEIFRGILFTHNTCYMRSNKTSFPLLPSIHHKSRPDSHQLPSPSTTKGRKFLCSWSRKKQRAVQQEGGRELV